MAITQKPIPLFICVLVYWFKGQLPIISSYEPEPWVVKQINKMAFYAIALGARCQNDLPSTTLTSTFRTLLIEKTIKTTFTLLTQFSNP